MKRRIFGASSKALGRFYPELPECRSLYFSSALPVNKLNLFRYRETNPSLLTPLNPTEKGQEPDANRPGIQGDVFIHPTAQVHPSAKLGPNVSVGARAIIGPGVRLKECIILDNVEVKVSSVSVC